MYVVRVFTRLYTASSCPYSLEQQPPAHMPRAAANARVTRAIVAHWRTRDMKSLFKVRVRVITLAFSVSLFVILFVIPLSLTGAHVTEVAVQGTSNYFFVFAFHYHLQFCSANHHLLLLTNTHSSFLRPLSFQKQSSLLNSWKYLNTGPHANAAKAAAARAQHTDDDDDDDSGNNGNGGGSGDVDADDGGDSSSGEGAVALKLAQLLCSVDTRTGGVAERKRSGRYVVQL
jgi:hypothetical protein